MCAALLARRGEYGQGLAIVRRPGGGVDHRPGDRRTRWEFVQAVAWRERTAVDPDLWHVGRQSRETHGRSAIRRDDKGERREPESGDPALGGRGRTRKPGSSARDENRCPKLLAAREWTVLGAENAAADDAPAPLT